MDRCPCPVFYNGSVAGSVTGSVRIGRIGAGVRAACSECAVRRVTGHRMRTGSRRRTFSMSGD